MSQQKLTAALKKAFRSARDPDRAESQQAYMKSSMPYYGITTPELRRICRECFGSHPPDDAESWRNTMRDLWVGAKFREERYAALELLGHRASRDYLDTAALPLLEEFIVTGAWWDFVDAIAPNAIGRLLSAYPDDLYPVLDGWSRADDVWLRRSAILAQLKFRERTDTRAMLRWMEPSLDSREFFLRKAIGWALREYSKTDADTVIDYVEHNRARLSPLSRREALRVLVKQKVVNADGRRLPLSRSGAGRAVP